MVPTQKMPVAGENEQFCPASGCPYGWADSITIYTVMGAVVVAALDSFCTSFRGGSSWGGPAALSLTSTSVLTFPSRAAFPSSSRVDLSISLPKRSEADWANRGSPQPRLTLPLHVSTLFT